MSETTGMTDGTPDGMTDGLPQGAPGGFEYDPGLVDAVAVNLDLREPNRDALDALARGLDQAAHGQLLVADLATGVGKTYVAAGLLDYLHGSGVRNVVIVTPGSTIQRKTVANLTPGTGKYVRGLQCRPVVVTLDDLERGGVAAALDDPEQMKVFVLTVQSLLRPDSKDARRAYRAHETLGRSLAEYLAGAEDLVVIADEHHVYAGNARRFAAAIDGLDPVALVGLTATPDPSTPESSVVYRYPLAAAIADGFVKIPVLVGRADRVRDTRTQLADAVALLDAKGSALAAWCEATGNVFLPPVLFVVAQTIEEASRIRDTLAQPDLIGAGDRVLLITSEEPDTALEALDRLEDPGSPVRAVVSVSMLKEGWDVKNIYVIASVRALESQLLSEQVLGRGLRLPYGRRTGVGMLDTVEVLSHHSFERLLDEAEVLLAQTLGERTAEARTSTEGSADAPGVPGVPGVPGSPDGDAFAEPSGALAAPLVPAADGPAGLPPAPPAPPRAAHSPQVAVYLPGPAGQGNLFDPEPDTEHQVGGIATVDARLGEARAAAQALAQPELPRQPGGLRTPWYLPHVRMRAVRDQMSLTTINLVEVEALGRAFADENAPTLTRKALNATRDDTGTVVLHVTDASHDAPVAAAQQRLPLASVEQELCARLMASNAVEQTVSESNAATRIAAAFLAGARVDETTTWRSEHSRLATGALVEWLGERQRAAGVRHLPEVTVHRWPDGDGARVRGVLPTDRNRVTGRAKFTRGHPYDGWEKSLYPSTRFDSWSAEFRLAELLDRAGQVRGWARIGVDVPLGIPYQRGAAAHTYVPDFLAVDQEGTWWVVEAKADGEMSDEVVQAKRDAAIAWVNAVNASGAVSARWGYVLVSETAIGNAADWTGLLAAGHVHR